MSLHVIHLTVKAPFEPTQQMPRIFGDLDASDTQFAEAERPGAVNQRLPGRVEVKFFKLIHGRATHVSIITAWLCRLLCIPRHKFARSMLTPLSTAQAQRLVSAMSEVERLLRASSVEIAPVDPASADAQHCLQRYFAELDARFSGGFDPGKGGGASDRADFLPPHGCLLLARLFGEPIGCGALRTLARGVGEIKRMWIAPDARGLSLGRRLLAELEREAMQRKFQLVRLDTNGTLDTALHLYRSSGYREIPRFNDNPYAQHWFEKDLINPRRARG